jgi:hypothetical protein
MPELFVKFGGNLRQVWGEKRPSISENLVLYTSVRGMRRLYDDIDDYSFSKYKSISKESWQSEKTFLTELV